MDPNIKMVYDSNIGIFSTYPDAAAKPEFTHRINDWIARYTAYTNSQSDITSYYQNLPATGLQEEQANILGALAMDGMQQQQQQQGSQPAAVVSVKEFVNQYQIPYAEVKQAGYRKRAQKAYEEIFAVADYTSDMQEAQLIFEKEQMLWNIVVTDIQDIIEPIIEAMDPLNMATTRPLIMYLEAIKKSASQAEMRYYIDFLEYPKACVVSQHDTVVNFGASICKSLLAYISGRTTLWSGPTGKPAEEAISKMVIGRQSLQLTFNTLYKYYGMTLNEVLDNEFMKLWLLAPKNVDTFGRIKTAMLPHNYEAFRYILENEVFSNRPLIDIILTAPPILPVLPLIPSSEEIFVEYATKRAEELNAHLTYYQYIEQLSGAAASHNIDIPGSKTKGESFGGKSFAGSGTFSQLGGGAASSIGGGTATVAGGMAAGAATSAVNATGHAATASALGSMGAAGAVANQALSALPVAGAGAQLLSGLFGRKKRDPKG